MKKNILFITPPYHAGVVESAGRWMPLSFVYLAGSVRKAGFKPIIYDAMSKQHDIEDIREYLLSIDFDYLAITSITSSLPASLDVLALVKEINPKVVTIMGGVHPTFCYEELFKEHNNKIDFIIYGEGELVLPKLLLNLENNIPLDEIRGLIRFENSKLIKAPHQPFIDDLDSIPTAWDLIDWEDYSYFVIPGSRLAAISTSRGCTHDCTFCSQQKFWQNTWRARYPEKIVEEIEMLKTEFGVNVFLIVDEYPTNERQRWEKFLDLLIQKDLDIYLLMETRVEDIVRDEDILWKYRKAGIIHIYIGIEATDQETLDLIKKDLNVELSKRAIDLIHSHGMITETSFVIGFPWDTKESIDRTVALAQHYGPDFAHFLAITPWPYADIYNEMKNNIVVFDYSKYNLVEPIIKPNSMTLDEVRNSILNCYRKYYMKKAPIYYKMKDSFKKDYLKRSMHLIMKNSFLSDLIKTMQRSGDFIDMKGMFK